MHYMDANWTYGEKAWRQLHKNAASNSEQVPEATPHKTAAVRPPTTQVGMNSYTPMDEQRQNDQLQPIYTI